VRHIHAFHPATIRRHSGDGWLRQRLVRTCFCDARAFPQSEWFDDPGDMLGHGHVVCSSSHHWADFARRTSKLSNSLNKLAAPNPEIASELNVRHHRRRIGEPERYAAGDARLIKRQLFDLAAALNGAANRRPAGQSELGFPRLPRDVSDCCSRPGFPAAATDLTLVARERITQ
jgi:hypothetical protein